MAAVDGCATAADRQRPFSWKKTLLLLPTIKSYNIICVASRAKGKKRSSEARSFTEQLLYYFIYYYCRNSLSPCSIYRGSGPGKKTFKTYNMLYLNDLSKAVVASHTHIYICYTNILVLYSLTNCR